MTKKTLKTGKNDFDDFGDNDSWGSDYSNNSDSKKKGPAGAVVKGVSEQLGRLATDESTYRAMVGKALPASYGELFDDYATARNTAQDIARQVKDDLQGPTNELAKALKAKLPSSFRRTHKTFDKLIESTNSYKPQRNIDAERNEVMTLELERVFQKSLGALDQAAADRQEEAEAIQNERDMLELKHRSKELQLLNTIARNSAVTSQATTGYQLAATKKSMQLQYKQTFLLTDILRVMTEQTKMQETYLKNIQKNTGLSEIDKTKLSTAFKGAVRDKFNSTVLSGGADAGSLFGNIHKNSKDFLASITSPMGLLMSGAASGMNADDLYDYDNMTQGGKAAHKLVNGLGGFFGKDLAGAGGKKTLEFLFKRYPGFREKIGKGAHGVKYLHTNTAGILEAFLKEQKNSGNFTDEIVNAFKSAAGEMIKGTSNDLKLGMEGRDTLSSATSFDNASRRSISEVIPGYLARILQELKVSRTGKEVPLEFFDFKSGSFKTKGGLKNSLQEDIKGSFGARNAFDTMAKDFKKSGLELSDEDIKAMQLSMAKKRLSGKNFIAKNLTESDFWSDLPEAQRKAITKAMGQYTQGEKGSEGIANIFGSLHEAFSSAKGNDPRTAIQNIVNSGQIDLLREMGYVKGNEIDIDKFTEAIMGFSGNQTNKEQYEKDIKAWNARQKMRGVAKKASGGLIGTGIDADDPMPTLKNFEGKAIDYTQDELLADAAGGRRRRARSISEGTSRRQRESVVNNNTVNRNYQLTGDSSWSSTLLDIRDILKAGFENLTKNGIKTTVEETTKSDKLDPLPVFNISDKVEDFKSLFSKDKYDKIKSAIEDHEVVKSMRKNLGDITLSDLKNKGKDLLGTGKDLAIESGKYAAKKGKEGIDELLLARLRAKAKIRSLAAFGAGRIDDLGKELPDYADLYIEGSMVARIIGAKIKEGAYRTKDGKVLKTLFEIAKHPGDIYDENNQIVMTVQEKATAYTAATFETFSQKLHALTVTALGQAGEIINNTLGLGNSVLRKGINFFKSTALAYAKELVVPPQDVYVKGDNPRTPRLYAWKMREGRYFRQIDDKQIEYPSMITGPVYEMVGDVPQILITDEDMNRGLEDANGNPFEKLGVRFAKAVHKGLGLARDAAGDLLSFGTKAGKKGLELGKAGVRGAGVFATSGLNGVLYGPDGVAYQTGGGTGEASIPVLEQIRDILDERLPVGGVGNVGGGFGGSRKRRKGTAGVKPASKAPEQTPETFSTVKGKDLGTVQTNPNIHAGPSRTNNSLSQLLGLGGMVGSGIMKAGQALGNVFKRRRGKGLGSVAEELVGPSRPSGEPSEKASSKGSGIMSKLAGLLGGAGVVGANKLTTVAPSKTATNAQGQSDDVKLNSTQDRINKMTNKNADSIKSAADFEGPEHFDNENVIDQLIGAVSGIKNQAGSMLEDAVDFLDGEGDDKKRRRGKKGRRAGAKERAKRMKASKAARVKAGKPGFFSRMTGKGASLIGKSIDYVGGKIAGAPGRVAAAKGFFNGATKLAGKVLGSQALKTAAGVLGVVLGGPVGWAIGAGMAAWTAWDVGSGIFKWLKDEKPETSLTHLRFYEYGFTSSTPAEQEAVAKLEAMCLKAIKESENSVEFDSNKMDLEAILKIFGVSEKDEDRFNELIKWIEKRFKPVMAKWKKALTTVKSDFSKVNDLDLDLKKQVLNYTISDQTGWDVINNPFSISTPLEVRTKEVLEAYDVIQKHLDQEIAKAPKKGAVDADKAFFGGTTKMAGRRNKPATTDGAEKPTPNADNGYKVPGAEKTNLWDKTGGSAVAISTLAIPKLPNNTLSALGAIRMYAYGLTSITKDKLRSLSLLEGEMAQYVNIDKDGKATITVDLEKSWPKIGKHFGIAGDNVKQLEVFKEWFNKRWLPVFTTFYSQLLFYTGAKDLDTALNTVKPDAAMAVANAVKAMPIWNITASPWGEDYPLGSLSGICDDSIRVIADKQAQEKVAIEKSPGTASPSSKPAATPPQKGPEQTVKQSVSFKTAVSADAEPDPAKSSASAGSGKGDANLTDKVPPVGSVKVAPGELFNGSGADAFLKFAGNAKLDGANPEMIRLFKGMVEEYASITGKKVQINDGFRSYEEQADLHRRMPDKAAAPGNSMHEFGLALDINSETANEMEKLGLMKKYGFTRPVGQEPWHIEPAGLQQALAYFKKNKEEATQAILASVGKGGGGVGMTKTGFRKGGRSNEAAKQWFEATGTAIEKAGSTGAGSSYAGSVDAVKTSPEENRAGFSDAAPKAGKPKSDIASISSGNQKPNLGSDVSYGKAAPTSDSEPDMTKLGSVNTSDMKDLVHKTAQAVGVDPGIAKMTVAVESNFKAGAAAGTSSATGLYQFTSGTWSDMVKKHGAKYGITADTPRTDPKANAIMGALLLKDNLKRAKSLGVPENAVGAYTMHFLGTGGAASFWRMGDDAIPANTMRDAAKANRNIFFNKDGSPRTKAQIVQILQGKLNTAAKAHGIESSDVASSPTSSSDVGTPASKDPSGMIDAVYRPGKENTSSGTVQAKYVPSNKAADASNDANISGFQQPIATPSETRAVRQHTSDENGYGNYAKIAKESFTVQSDQLKKLGEIHETLKLMLQAATEGKANNKSDMPKEPDSSGKSDAKVDNTYMPPRRSVLDGRVA